MRRFTARSQYLVGHLAPLAGAALIDDNAVQACANAEALAEGGGVLAPRGRRNDVPTPTTTHIAHLGQGLMIPASMGFTAQVPPDLALFTITASWITLRDRREAGGDQGAGRDSRAIAVISSRLHRLSA